MYILEEPEKRTIRQLVEMSEKDLGIPDFQRPYVWGKQDVEDFFESIARGYYVGALLFWNPGKVIDIGTTPVYGVTIDPAKLEPRYLVLDGQQRVSSLYYVTRAPKLQLWNTKKPYVFFLDIEKLTGVLEGGDSENVRLVDSRTLEQAKKEGLLDRETQFKGRRFPIFDIHQFHNWLDDFEDYLQKAEKLPREKARELKTKLRDRLDYIYERFQIPVIRLPENLELGNVAKIFEKLNSTGVYLTVFDLLNARLIKHEIRLRRLWEAALEKYDTLREFSRSNERFPVSLLQTVALLRNKQVQKKDLLELNPANFQSDWETACESMDIAIDRISNLRDGFGVVSSEWLPYAPMLPVLSALLKKIEGRKDQGACMDKIRSWYWASVFTNAYEAQTETQMANDYKIVSEWFDNPSKKPLFVANFDTRSIDIRSSNRSTNAIYRGVVCLVAMKGAKDFVTGTVLELNKLDDHHIFARSKAKEFKADDINTVLNRTLIDKTTNRKYVRAMKPSEYLERIVKDHKVGESELRKRLESHIISGAAFERMKVDDFAGFVTQREKDIKSEISRVIEN